MVDPDAPRPLADRLGLGRLPTPAMRRLSRVLYYLVVAGLLVWLGLRVWPRPLPDADVAPLGPPAGPDGVTLDGAPFALDDLRGRVVVLNFWATWCPPCHAETPGLVRLAEGLDPADVVVVGASMDRGGAEPVRRFVARYGVPYPVVLASPSLVARAGGVPALPTTLVLDRAGRVRYRHEGFVVPAALRPTLRALARETPTP